MAHELASALHSGPDPARCAVNETQRLRATVNPLRAEGSFARHSTGQPSWKAPGLRPAFSPHLKPLIARWIQSLLVLHHMASGGIPLASPVIASIPFADRHGRF